jgi:CelD/BcsL family acetyltransferase involved in cellulose biosynthesis
MLVETHESIQAVDYRGVIPDLRSEWDHLWNQDYNATPFQTASWLLRWHEHLGNGEFLLLACRKNDQLIGLLPLNLVRNGTQHELQFLGEGISDHLAPITLPESEEAVVTAFWEYLLEGKHAAERCVLRDLLASSSFNNLAPDQMARDHATPCPRLSFKGRRTLQEVLPEKHFRNLNYYRSRGSRLGLKYETASEANFEELFSAFLNLHTARWQARGSHGVLSEASIKKFHRAVAWDFLKSGALRLYAVRHGADIIASLYGFAGHRTTFYYLGGFDPRFSSLSPGMLLVGHAIEEAIMEGQTAFDFLRGCEPYKYSWGSGDTAKVSLTLQQPSNFFN